MSSHASMKSASASRAAVLCLAVAVATLPAMARSADPPRATPSRPPAPGCAWEKFSDPALGLDAWVQRCNFHSSKLDFVTVEHSLAIRYSDGGAPDPVIDVLDLLPSEAPEAGIKRFFAAHTEKSIAARCRLAPYGDAKKYPAGVQRYTFLPDAAYEKELAAKADPEEVPDPPCGEWGDAPDGIQYFEAQPASGVAKVLFVRLGQDEPLFDEDSLRLH